MRRVVAFVFLCALFAAGTQNLAAQYFDWGNSPASLKWDQLRTPDARIIYPRTFEENARRMAVYFDSLRPHAAYGYRHGTMEMPVILHTQNMAGNGIVLWAPRRIELLAAPGSSYSEPWLKQLAVHEYRHNVQYNNLNRGTIRALGWFLGEQIKFLGPGMFSMFLLEGDAVMIETEMSAFGRGFQPSFTMHYRAVGDVGSDRHSRDFWFCGSYREYVPDHYRLGYQMVRWGYHHYGDSLLDNSANYIARNPQFLFPLNISLRKYYGTNLFGLFRDAFGTLNEYWATLPEVEDSASKIASPTTSHTTYEWPMWLDNRTLVAFKRDLDKPLRIVSVDTATGHERHIAWTGSVSSRPELHDGAVVWTEYERSTLWGQRVNSRIRRQPLDGGRMQTVPGRQRQAFYPAFGKSETPALVTYDRETGIFGIATPEGSVAFPSGIEITGLAWDDLTEKYYFIGLDDGGMWLGEADGAGGTYSRLTPSRHITISDLRAQGGRLWYGSIASGRDEAHCYDLVSGTEYRLTTSKYGSFQPSPDARGERIALTTYDRGGYKLSLQEIGTPAVQEQREIPLNLVNPDWKRWDLPKMDSMVFTEAESTASHKKYHPRRFHKGLNLFNPHSWLPLDLYPPDFLEEASFDPNLGATVMSQSLLSDMVSWLGYGWSRAGGSSLKGGLSYNGLGAQLDVNFTWGGGRQAAYTSLPAGTERRKFFSAATRLSLPMSLTSGAIISSLIPSAEYYYTNGLLFRMLTPTTGKLTRGVERLTFALSYSMQVRMAHRDFLPRWGFSARGSYVLNPTNRDFLGLYTLSVRGLFPGALPHHSTSLRLSWQEAVGQYDNNSFIFGLKEMFPRGALYNFLTMRWVSGSLDYQFPVWCPDGGIPGILYFKRIRLNIFGDYARWEDTAGGWHPLYSYGGDIILDLSPIRMPGATTVTTTLTIAKPSDRRGVAVSFGVSIPL